MINLENRATLVASIARGRRSPFRSLGKRQYQGGAVRFLSLMECRRTTSHESRFSRSKPPVDGGLDEIGREEGKRDCHSHLADESDRQKVGFNADDQRLDVGCGHSAHRSGGGAMEKGAYGRGSGPQDR
jgi:hypothetical protein